MQLLLFCGVQASGKSSYYKAHFADTHIRLNLDMLRTRHREALLFHACLQAKQPCVIDNTNPTAAARAKYLTPARAAHFQSIAYYFETPLADALARNATRSGPVCSGKRYSPSGHFGGAGGRSGKFSVVFLAIATI